MVSIWWFLLVQKFLKLLNDTFYLLFSLCVYMIAKFIVNLNICRNYWVVRSMNFYSNFILIFWKEKSISIIYRSVHNQVINLFYLSFFTSLMIFHNRSRILLNCIMFLVAIPITQPLAIVFISKVSLQNFKRSNCNSCRH